MAKVFAPFLSLGAKGTVAKTLTASVWKGREYIKQRFIPHNPKSSKQVAVRSVLTDGVSKWRHCPGLITAADKVLWESYGAKHQISGINRFMKFYLKENYDSSTGTKKSPQVIPKPQ